MPATPRDLLPHAINLAQKLALFDEHWAPRVVAEMNDYAECHALIVEPRGVVNTGDVASELTARNDAWV